MATLKNTVIDDTGYLDLPIGTIAQRPVSPEAGMVRYVSSANTSSVEYYNGTNWVSPSTGVRTDGLMFHLDAANSSSYPGSGNIWKDLSGNKFDAVIIGTNPWASTPYGGVMNLPLSNAAWISLSPNGFHNLTHRRKWSLELWMTPNSDTTEGYFFSISSFPNDNAWITYFETDSISLYQYDMTSGSKPTYTVDVPMQIVIVCDDQTTYLYKNGTLASSWIPNVTYKTINDFTHVQAMVLDEEADSVIEGIQGGFSVNQDTSGKFSVVRMYNRVISSTEVSTNYNELKSRFGLS